MIEIDGLTKRYGDKTAVDGLSFVVGPGVVTGGVRWIRLLLKSLAAEDGRSSSPRT
jgi:ABC-type uncharacterized transport system ATPase subunit